MARARAISLAYLERAALFYLERYASSAANLRRVLQRKLLKRAKEQEIPADASAWIDQVVAKLTGTGLLNDLAFAESRVRRLFSEGKSLSRIRQTLIAKGVDKPTLEKALARLEIEAPGPVSDLPAAIKFARKRRLGPFSADPEARREKRQKDIAALARRGFPPEIARRVVNAPDIEALEMMLDE